MLVNDLLNHLGSYRDIIHFRLVLPGIVSLKILESSRLVFSEKISLKNFVLLDAEDNTSVLSNRAEFHN